MRSKAGIFGLEAISRNLFNAKSPPSISDIFGGSVASRRTRASTVSRSNTTASTATSSRDSGSIAQFSQRSRSTAGTSVYDDDASVASKPRSISRSRKLFGRGKSPALGAESDHERSPKVKQSPRRLSRAQSEGPAQGWSDGEDDAPLSRSGPQVNSEWNLRMRLDLARQNSEAQTQSRIRTMSEPPDMPVYEGRSLDDGTPRPVTQPCPDLPPESLRPQSRASRDTASYRSVTPTPGPEQSDTASMRPSLQVSTSSDRRPIGPRTPSPMPMQSPASDGDTPPRADTGSMLEGSDGPRAPMLSPAPGDGRPHLRSPIPRSHRMPFDLPGLDATPKASAANTSVDSKSSAVNPLSIKKKASLRDESPVKRTHAWERPDILKTSGRSRSDSAPRQLRSVGSAPLRGGEDEPEAETRVRRLAVATKLDVSALLPLSLCHALNRRPVARLGALRRQTHQAGSVQPATDDQVRAELADPRAAQHALAGRPQPPPAADGGDAHPRKRWPPSVPGASAADRPAHRRTRQRRSASRRCAR
jgi:hypothetical protein